MKYYYSILLIFSLCIACSKQLDSEVVVTDSTKLDEVKNKLVEEGFTITNVDTKNSTIHLKVKYSEERINKAKTICSMNTNIKKVNVKGLFSKSCPQKKDEKPEETKEEAKKEPEGTKAP